MPATEPSGAASQLLLKFLCHACARPVRVPLSKTKLGQPRCPACMAVLHIPALDQTVDGLEVVRGLFVSVCYLDCPECERRLKVPADQVGKSRKCRGCGCRLHFQLFAEPDAEPPRNASARSSTNGRPPHPSTSTAHAAASGPRPVRSGEPPRPEHHGPRGRSHRSVPAPPPPPPRNEPLDEEEPMDLPEGPEPIVYGSQTGRRSRHGSTGGGLATSPRLIVHSVYWAAQLILPFTLLVIGGSMNNAAIGFAALVCFLPRVASIITAFVAPLLVQRFNCPGCGQDYEAVGQWKCSCGFSDYRERHILRFHCPLCKNYIGWTNCARCGCTIRVR